MKASRGAGGGSGADYAVQSQPRRPLTVPAAAFPGGWGVYADKLGSPSLPRGSKAAAGPSSGSRGEKAAAGERSAARAGPPRPGLARGRAGRRLGRWPEPWRPGQPPGWAGSSPPPAPGCELSRPASHQAASAPRRRRRAAPVEMRPLGQAWAREQFSGRVLAGWARGRRSQG